MLFEPDGRTIFNHPPERYERIYINESSSIHIFKNVDGENNHPIFTTMERICNFVVIIFKVIISGDFYLSNAFLKAQWLELRHNRRAMIFFTDNNCRTNDRCSREDLINIRNRHAEMPQSYQPYDTSNHNALPEAERELHFFYLRSHHAFPGNNRTFREFRNATVFSFNSDRLPMPSTIGRLNRLQTIECNSLALTEIPESVGQITNLKTLDIAHSSLQTLPNSLSNLQHLEHLFLQRNQFREVPEFLFNMRNIRTINLMFNPLSNAAIQRINQHNRSGEGAHIFYSGLHYEAGNNIRISCEAALKEWCSDKDSGDTILKEWTQDQKDYLSMWLQKLKDSADYISEKTRPRLMQNVDDILKWLAVETTKLAEKVKDKTVKETDKEEMGVAHTILEGASRTCGDRVVLPINELTMRRKIAQSPDMDLKDLKNLVISNRRYTIIRDIAAQHCKKNRSGDPIEVYLHYETYLRDILMLEVKNMRHEPCSDVTEEDLKKAREHVLSESALDILSKDPLWEKEIRRRQDPRFKAIEEACEAEKEKALDQLSTKISEGEGVDLKHKGLTDWNPVYQYTKELLNLSVGPASLRPK